LLTLCWIACSGCDSSLREVSPSKPDATALRGIEIVQVGSEEQVTEIVRREIARAEAEHRKLLVYVGATWCEPCKHFHDAAAAGRLDTAFPNLRLLEFDHDRYGERLERAGCASEYLPLFAKPEPGGRCSATARIEGSIKGNGAVSEITPRLAGLLGP
jgi:hypothetical protein